MLLLIGSLYCTQMVQLLHLQVFVWVLPELEHPQPKRLKATPLVHYCLSVCIPDSVSLKYSQNIAQDKA